MVQTNNRDDRRNVTCFKSQQQFYFILFTKWTCPYTLKIILKLKNLAPRLVSEIVVNSTDI